MGGLSSMRRPPSRPLIILVLDEQLSWYIFCHDPGSGPPARAGRFLAGAAGAARPGASRPAGRNAAPHPGLAPRGGGAALRHEPDLVQLDRAGPAGLGLA